MNLLLVLVLVVSASALSPSPPPSTLIKLPSSNSNLTTPTPTTTPSRPSPWYVQTFTPTSYTPPPLYRRYVLLNQLQSTCTSLRNTLSSLYILQALDKSSAASAVALTATLTFLTRDGAGMLSTLLFSRLAQPFSLKSDVKRWRFAADVSCNIALFLEFVCCNRSLSLFKLTLALR